MKKNIRLIVIAVTACLKLSIANAQQPQVVFNPGAISHLPFSICNSTTVTDNSITINAASPTTFFLNLTAVVKDANGNVISLSPVPPCVNGGPVGNNPVQLYIDAGHFGPSCVTLGTPIINTANTYSWPVTISQTCIMPSSFFFEYEIYLDCSLLPVNQPTAQQFITIEVEGNINQAPPYNSNFSTNIFALYC